MIIKRESFMFVILWVMSATPRECSLYSVEAEAQQDDLPRHQLTAGRATTGLLVCWFPVQHAAGVQVAQRHLVLHLFSGLPRHLRQSWEVPLHTHCLPALPSELREAEIQRSEEGKGKMKRRKMSLGKVRSRLWSFCTHPERWEKRKHAIVRRWVFLLFPSRPSSSLLRGY